jgi:protein SCO1/2
MNRRRLAAAPLLGLWLAACSTAPDGRVADVREPESEFAGTVAPTLDRPALVLPDTEGRAVDLRDRPAGEVTVVFFGYTTCPDLCSTTMADLALAEDALTPSERERTEIVFVAEDPQRDTPEAVRRYLAAFDPTFTGLIGGNEQSAQAIAALGSTATEIVDATPPSHEHAVGSGPHDHPTGRGYLVEHTSIVYAFSADRTVIYTGGTTPDQYAEDFRLLLAE